MLKNTIFIALIVFIFSGCSRMIPVKPEYQSVNPAERISGDLSGEIQLINNQNKNAEEYFSDFSIHKLTGNMHDWT